MARPRHRRLACLGLALLALTAVPVLADFARGFDAWDRGDYDTAMREFSRAAEGGDVRAQNHLAQMLEDGQGTAVDMTRAVAWYRRAAEAGNPSAQLNLGRLYRSGKGVEQSDAQAVHWYQAAANQGLAIAQFFMGLMYDTGKGVPSDYVKAYKWFDLAARQGDPDARHKRDRLAEHMTPSQIVEAERLTRVFLGEGVAAAPRAAGDAPQGGPERSSAAAAGGTGAASATRLALARPASASDVPAGTMADVPDASALTEAEMRAVQTLLNDLGYNAGTVDGIAGTSTHEALARFREDTGQGAGGTAVDRAALVQLEYVRSVLPDRPSRPPGGAPLVRRIQEALINLGYEPGPADGLIGSRTTGAARDYRRDLGLEPDDTLNHALLAALETRLAVRGTARRDGQREQAAAAIAAASVRPSATAGAPVAPATPAPAAAGAASATPISGPAAAPPSGEALVRRLQAALASLGFDPGPVDGKPGSRTGEAIRAFQRSVGLTVDGEPSAELLGRLEPLAPAAAPPAPVFQPPADETERVQRVQRALARLGLDPGPDDGMVGRRTREAVERFQSRMRLEPDGRITDELLRRMESPEATRLSGPRLRFVKPASERELVRRIQVRLNSLGYPAGAPDGVAGEKTEAAVRAFQQASALPEGGALDEALLRQLESNEAQRNETRRAATTARPELVRDIQRELNRLGYPAGDVDGIVGSRTVNAARAFQHAVGVQADGELDTELLRALRAAR